MNIYNTIAFLLKAKTHNYGAGNTVDQALQNIPAAY
jgi:hypothetical protein